MSLYSYTYRRSHTSTLTHDQIMRRILIRCLSVLFSLFIFLLSSLLLNNMERNYVSPVTAQTSTNEQSTPLRPTGYAGQATQQFNNLTISPSPTPLPAEALAKAGYHLCNTCDRDGISNLPSPSPTLTILSPSPSQLNPIPSPLNPAKSFYTIAIIGDSMVDTMGEVLEYLDSALKNKYPQSKFLLYNYGTGAQNIEMGVNRFGSHFKYQSRDYQSLPELKPDILIVASFSYNPFTPHDRNRHWLGLTNLVQQAQSVSQNVYMLAEIAPLRADFGNGPQGVNWSDYTNYEHSGRIIEQLQNAIGLSKSLNVPLIDAFSPSFNSSTQEGNRSFVNPSDGIHPSVEGHQFMAEKIAQVIKLE